MHPIFIINQDRNDVYAFDSNAHFYTAPVFYGGTMMGLNLFMDNCLLGTFDRVIDAMEEIESIYHCTRRVYTINKVKVIED